MPGQPYWASELSPHTWVCEVSSNEHKLPLLRNPMTAGSRILVGPLAQPPSLAFPQWER